MMKKLILMIFILSMLGVSVNAVDYCGYYSESTLLFCFDMNNVSTATQGTTANEGTGGSYLRNCDGVPTYATNFNGTGNGSWDYRLISSCHAIGAVPSGNAYDCSGSQPLFDYGNRTINLWVNMSNITTQNDYIFGHANSVGNYGRMLIRMVSKFDNFTANPDGEYNDLQIDVGSKRTIYTDLPYDSWFMISVTQNEENFSTYINGSNKKLGYNISYTTSSGYCISFGCSSLVDFNPFYFDGYIDEVMMWNETKSDSFISGLYNYSGLGSTPIVATCNDGIDNDGDTFIDFPTDPDCSSALDAEDVANLPQCSDGLDNDGDFFIDYPEDPDCVNATDNESVFNPTECFDNIDNDGDGFIDWGEDPSCSGINDKSEAPFDTTQCNDGIDNDVDGFIDLADTSCSQASDDNEFPKQSSTQPEDECLASLDCVIYDNFLYGDSPQLHDWEGNFTLDQALINYPNATQEVNVVLFDKFSENSMLYDTLAPEGVVPQVVYFVNITKPIQNTNDYNALLGTYKIGYEPTGADTQGQEIYVGFRDYDGDLVASMLLNASQGVYAYPYEVEIDMYIYNNTGYEYFSTAYLYTNDEYLLTINFYLNENEDSYTIGYVDDIGTFGSIDTYFYGSDSWGQIQSAWTYSGFNDSILPTYLDSVSLYGQDLVGLESSCAEFELPYRLREYFNGYLSDCGWNADPDGWNWGYLEVINDYDNYMLFKEIEEDDVDAIYYDDSRHSVVEFDLTIYDDSTQSSVVNLFLYDLDFNNAWGRFSYKNNGTITASEEGNTKIITNSMALNVSLTHKIVIDLTTDTYDYYLNNTKVASDVGFHEEFLNVEYFNGIYFQSALSHYAIDNLDIYESDDSGNPKVNSDINPSITPNEERSICGLFYEVEVRCNEDSECETGACLVNGKCSSFDFTYCDENAHKRGNMCVVSGVTACVLESSGELILDNFFLFLVLIIFIMGFVYLAIMLRR